MKVAIVGRGRIGAGLGLAWTRRGASVTLLARSAGTSHGLPVITGRNEWPETIALADCVVVATPDREIPGVARELALDRAIHARHVVLHTSGLLDRRALDPLATSGAALGSLHPLMAVSRAEDAPSQLEGAFAGIEGDPAAMAMAGRLAILAGLIPVPIPSGAKAGYHAAAAMVSNFTVTLYDAARRVAEENGMAPDSAARIYLPLLRGTVGNLEAQEPAAALTGAIRRGDAETVLAHLRALRSSDLRRLYIELGKATLRLAREAGLDEAAAERVADALDVDQR
jgi:predicted short-subunit dehydrogenase-like oxidoreductase (DUF2520 family)